jgi:acetolactate synthase-1/2/3 large subunit
MVKVWQKLFFDGRLGATDNVNPDFVMLAQAYGIEAFSCDNVNDLPAAVERFVNAKGPVLADFRVVPDICLPMVAPGKGLHEMFLPGTITFDDEVMPEMTGDAPS